MMFRFFTPLVVTLSLPSLALDHDSLPSRTKTPPISKLEHSVVKLMSSFKEIKETGKKAPKIFPKEFPKSPHLTYDIFEKMMAMSPLGIPLSQLEGGHPYYTKLFPTKTGVYIYCSNTMNQAGSLLKSDRFILEQSILHKNDHLDGTYEFHYVIDGNMDIFEDTVFMIGHILLFYTSYSTLERYIPKSLKDKETFEKSERYRTSLAKNLATWVKGAGSWNELYGEETRFIRKENLLPHTAEGVESGYYAEAETSISGEDSDLEVL